MRDLSQARILVTGGAGFIGCSLSQRLAAECSRYVVLDNLHEQVHQTRQRPERLAAAAELIVGDVTDAAVLDRVLLDLSPDVIVHLAAETGTAQSLSEATRHANVNVVGTTQLIDALTRAAQHAPHFVLCSSRAIYGEGEWERPDRSRFYPGPRTHAQLAAGQWDFPGATPIPSEATVTNPAPTSVYGGTKLAQEHILSAWCSSNDAQLSILRLQNVYGPGQSLTNSYTGIVALFSQLARAGKTIPVYEDGRITRDFVYIDDVADAIVAAVHHGSSLLVDIGSGLSTTVLELASEIALQRGAPEPSVNGMFRDGDVRHAACVVLRASEVLGWRPKWNLQDGLRALQEWIDGQLTD